MDFIGSFGGEFCLERLLALIFAMLITTGCAFAASPTNLNLAGKWRFALDSGDAGIKGAWFNRSLEKSIQLPGILQAQGYGNEISTNTPWVLSLYDQVLVFARGLSGLHPAGQRQGAVPLPATPALPRRGLVPARHRDS